MCLDSPVVPFSGVLVCFIGAVAPLVMSEVLSDFDGVQLETEGAIDSVHQGDANGYKNLGVFKKVGNAHFLSGRQGRPIFGTTYVLRIHMCVFNKTIKVYVSCS